MAKQLADNQYPNPLYVWLFLLAEFYADSILRQADSQNHQQLILFVEKASGKKAGGGLPQPPP